MKITVKRNSKNTPFYLIDIDGKEKSGNTLPALKAGSIDEIDILGIFHLIDAKTRCDIIVWAYKTLKKGGVCRIISPHWSHSKAYADPGVVWPPVTAEFFFLTNKGVREAAAPHVDTLPVDFDYNVAGAYDPNDAWIAGRNDETKQVFMHRNINVTTEIIATLTKKG